MSAAKQVLEIACVDFTVKVERIRATSEIRSSRLAMTRVVVVGATGDGQFIVGVMADAKLADREHFRTLARQTRDVSLTAVARFSMASSGIRGYPTA